ncbi:hypothetical protein NPIL_257541, partial [Nephila pilipes]
IISQRIKKYEHSQPAAYNMLKELYVEDLISGMTKGDKAASVTTDAKLIFSEHSWSLRS